MGFSGRYLCFENRSCFCSFIRIDFVTYVFQVAFTTWKVSKCGVFSGPYFLYSDWIRRFMKFSLYFVKDTYFIVASITLLHGLILQYKQKKSKHWKFECHQHKGPCIKYVRKIFRKTNISNPLIRTCTSAYQGVRNVSFSENFAYVIIMDDR